MQYLIYKVETSNLISEHLNVENVEAVSNVCYHQIKNKKNSKELPNFLYPIRETTMYKYELQFP